jgi:hypothetical protein
MFITFSVFHFSRLDHLHFQSLLGWYHYAIWTPQLALASLASVTQIELVLYCVTSSKVVKASTVVTILCHCCWHFCLNAHDKLGQCKNGFGLYEEEEEFDDLETGPADAASGKAVIWKSTIEIGLGHACFVISAYFPPSFEHVKNLLIMGPNKTKNCSLKCDFLILNYE